MKVLKTDINGGFPFDLDDIRWFEAGVRESLTAVGEMIGGNFAIIPPTLSISLSGVTNVAGKVFANGEFCDVDERTIPLAIPPGNVLFWEYVEYAEPSGSEVFENATTNDTYFRNHYILNVGPSVPINGIPIGDFAATGLTSMAGKLLAKLLVEPFVHLNKVIFNNGSTVVGGTGDNGYILFTTTESNADIVTFTTPVTGLFAIQDDAIDYSGMWRIIKFEGTGGTTEMKIVHQSGTAAGTKFKINCPGKQDRLIRSGDVCLFWNDGTNWNLISGGRPYPKTLTLVGGYVSVGAPFDITPAALKNAESLVCLFANVTLSSYTTGVNDLICTLPTKYRPAAALLFPTINRNTPYESGFIEVFANGEVKLFFPGLTASSVAVSLNHISFYSAED